MLWDISIRISTTIKSHIYTRLSIDIAYLKYEPVYLSLFKCHFVEKTVSSRAKTIYGKLQWDTIELVVNEKVSVEKASLMESFYLH